MASSASRSISIPVLNLASAGLEHAMLPVSKNIVQLIAKDHPVYGKYHGRFFKRHADFGGEALELVPESEAPETDKSQEKPASVEQSEPKEQPVPVTAPEPTLEDRVVAFRENESALSQDLAALIQCVGQIVDIAQSDGIQPTPGDLMVPVHDGPPLTDDVMVPKGQPSSALEKTKPSSAKAYSDRPDMAIAASKKQAVADWFARLSLAFKNVKGGLESLQGYAETSTPDLVLLLGKLDRFQDSVRELDSLVVRAINVNQDLRNKRGMKQAASAPARKPLKVVNPDVPTLIESFFQKNPQSGHALIDTSDDPGRPHFFQVRNEGGQWSIRSMEMSYKFGPPQQYPSLKALGDALDQNTSGRYRVVTGKLAEAARFAAELD